MAIHSGILAWRIPRTEGSLEDCSPWGHKESDMTEATQHAHGTDEQCCDSFR